jgi:hypothetical protein
MTKEIILLLGTLALSVPSFCQDIIYRTNGDSIVCKITKTDDKNIYFNLIKNDKEVATHINRNDIREYKTNVVMGTNLELNYKRNLLFISFDPLNFLINGPAVTGELTLQGKNKTLGFGIFSGYRFISLGLLASGLSPYDFKSSSYTIPIGCRIYLNAHGRIRGVFIGPYLEFGKVRFAEWEDHMIQAYGVEYGYRFVGKSRFAIELTTITGILKYGTPGDWVTGFYPTVTLKFGIII